MFVVFIFRARNKFDLSGFEKFCFLLLCFERDKGRTLVVAVEDLSQILRICVRKQKVEIY